MTEAEREAFELLPDDERQCEVCKTTCFLSAMTCNCNSESLVCLRHYTSLCTCPPEKHTLRYRYTLDELPLMLQKLKLKAESFDNWVNLVKDALDPNTPKTMDLSQFKELLREAEEKKFPKSDLLQTLTMAVEDADKCASVIHQLDLNKVRTRTRNSADTKYKLTVEELTLFCEEIDSLACTLKEAKNVKDLLKQTQDFQKESSRLLRQSMELLNPTELEQCIDSVSGLCIELPELRHLRNRLSQVTWLKEVKAMREKCEGMTVETLRNLLSTGIALPVDTILEKELAELQSILTDVEEWEEKAKQLLESQTPCSLMDIEVMLSCADNIEAFLPSEEVLRDIVKKAKEWNKSIDEIQSGENYPYFDTLEEIIKKGRAIPVVLKELERLESQYTCAKNWKERTARTFLRKNCATQLMEALSPRSFTATTPIAKAPGKKRNQNEEEPTLSFVANVKLGGNLDPASVVSAFKEAEEHEMESIRTLRSRNLRKFSKEGGELEVYCVCRTGLSGLMMQCELCKDWYHSTCVPLPKPIQTAPSKVKSSHNITTFKEMKFLCSRCLRTRRPRLETILSLLVSLQKLSVRLPEGEALQCLTERAMNWQDRARQLLAADELANALTKLSMLSQKYVEQVAREKTEKIISTELKKAANNPELVQRVQAITSMNIVSKDDSQTSDASAESDALDSTATSVDSGKGSKSSQSDDFTNSEHTYSLSLAIPEEQLAKEAAMLQISDATRDHMEELLMEGDLLEVSLDETTHIWKLLQATRTQSDHERTCIDFDVCIRVC